MGVALGERLAKKVVQSGSFGSGPMRLERHQYARPMDRPPQSRLRREPRWVPVASGLSSQIALVDWLQHRLPQPPRQP